MLNHNSHNYTSLKTAIFFFASIALFLLHYSFQWSHLNNPSSPTSLWDLLGYRYFCRNIGNTISGFQTFWSINYGRTVWPWALWFCCSNIANHDTNPMKQYQRLRSFQTKTYQQVGCSLSKSAPNIFADMQNNNSSSNQHPTYKNISKLICNFYSSTSSTRKQVDHPCWHKCHLLISGFSKKTTLSAHFSPTGSQHSFSKIKDVAVCLSDGFNLPLPWS